MEWSVQLFEQTIFKSKHFRFAICDCTLKGRGLNMVTVPLNVSIYSGNGGHLVNVKSICDLSGVSLRYINPSVRGCNWSTGRLW